MQERALRFVYRDYRSGYEDLLDQAKLQSLHLGRLRSLATEIDKAVHGGAPTYVSSLFNERESEYNLRRNHSLIMPPFNTISYGIRRTLSMNSLPKKGDKPKSKREKQQRNQWNQQLKSTTIIEQ